MRSSGGLSVGAERDLDVRAVEERFWVRLGVLSRLINVAPRLKPKARCQGKRLRNDQNTAKVPGWLLGAPPTSLRGDKRLDVGRMRTAEKTHHRANQRADEAFGEPVNIHPMAKFAST